MKRVTKLLLTNSLLLLSLCLSAQKGDTLDIRRNENGSIAFARFQSSESRKMSESTHFLKTILKAKQEDEFRLAKENTDKWGFTHHRYHQYYKGIRVENAEYLLHGKNGVIETINGDFQQVNIPSIKPAITEQRALQNALKYAGAERYIWEDAFPCP